MGTCTRCGDPHPPETTTCPRTDAPVFGGPCGTVVDRYRVERLLGTGGHGAVYRARHLLTERWVALKMLRPDAADAEGFERLVREARAATSIGSPRIVQVFDCGVSEAGDAFMAMELLEGRDLRALVAREGRLPMERSLDLVLQVLDALGDAHARGIVHRDVKPANVFVTRAANGSDLVKVLDFGISKVTAPGAAGLTGPGQAMGTPGYMAPEQFVSARDVDARADVYAAAVILYELLSGRRPFDGDTFERLAVEVHGRPLALQQAAPSMPASLCAIVDRALSRDPDGRWPTARAFGEALRGSSPTLASLPLGGASLPPGGFSLPQPPTTRAEPALGVAPPSPQTATHRDPPAFAAPFTPQAQPVAPPTPAVAPVAATPPVAMLPPQGSMGQGQRTAVIALSAAIVAVAASATAFVLFLRAHDEPTGASSQAARQAEGASPRPSPKAGTGPTQPADDDDGEEPAAPAPAPGKKKGAAATPGGGTAGSGKKLAILTSKGVTIGEPAVVGDLDTKEIVAVLKRALPTMDTCRRPGVADDVKAQIHVHPGPKITLAQAHPDNKGDPAVARCVANRFKEAAPGWKPGETGIISFEVRLDP